jgi:hypothetical protein
MPRANRTTRASSAEPKPKSLNGEWHARPTGYAVTDNGDGTVTVRDAFGAARTMTVAELRRDYFPAAALG